MTFRAYDVVIGYSEVCFKVIANSQEEAVEKALDMADFSPEREPFICYAYTTEIDSHAYSPIMRHMPADSYRGQEYSTYREVCAHDGCARTQADPLHVALAKEGHKKSSASETS